jgi:hypothetical protein
MKALIEFMRNKEKTALAVVSVFGLVWIFGAFLANLSLPDSSYTFLGTSGKAKLDPGKPITQTFEAKRDHLDQIKVMIGNTGLWPTEKVVFELADSTCEHITASNTMTFLTPDPHIYYHFNFPAIPDSSSKRYCFRATYFSRFDRGGDRPYLATSEDEQFAGWAYYNTGNDRFYEDRTLQIRPAYGTGSLLGDLSALVDRMSQYKPGFMKESALIFVFSVFMLGTLALLWYLIHPNKED